MGYRYSPPWYPPGLHHPGYTPALRTSPASARVPAAGSARGLNEVVGLKSVGQLSLYVLISGFQGITEVYNLTEIGRINNHYDIPGNKKAGVSNPWTSPLFSQQWSMKR